MSQQLRSHQRLVDRIMQAIASNETEVRDVLAAVTPGGGRLCRKVDSNILLSTTSSIFYAPSFQYVA